MNKSVLQSLYPERIGLLRALPGLGDFLCLVPTLRSLRRTYPDATLTLIGLRANQPLVERFSTYLDALLDFPGYPGLPEQVPQVQHLPDFLQRIQAQSFDLALQIHGNGVITNPLTVAFNAQTTAGFYLEGQYCPDPRTYLPWQSNESEIRRYLRLLRHLGIAVGSEALEFPITTAEKASFTKLAAAYALSPGRYICLHPGASIPQRRWPTTQFAQVGDRLAGQGWQIVLTGSAAEQDITQAVAQAMSYPAIDLAGKTELGTLAALLRQARLLICNDTGISHLAAALQVPSVVIFTTSDPRRWAPLDRSRHHVIAAQIASVATVGEQAEQLLQEVQIYAGFELSGSEASPQRFLVIQPGNREHICQMLPALKALQNIFPAAEITLLIGEAIEPRLGSVARLWVRPLTNLPALLPHLQTQAFTAAFLFTPPGHSPHPLAYACYCAGIPLRIGQSVEFGGGVLSHWVKPLPTVAPGEHYLHLLTAIAELTADQLRPPGQQPAAWPDQKETIHAHASS